MLICKDYKIKGGTMHSSYDEYVSKYRVSRMVKLVKLTRVLPNGTEIAPLLYTVGSYMREERRERLRRLGR